jgi:hypothetical protein
MVLPKAQIGRLALSTNVGSYRRLRIPIVLHLTQDSPWLRRLSGNSESRARRNKTAFQQIERDTRSRERVHLASFVFMDCA